MNNPQHVMSRLIHKGDYFKLINPVEMELFKPIIDKHISKCMHPDCIKSYNDNINNITIP